MGPATLKTNPFDIFMSLKGHSEDWESDSDEMLDYDSPPHDSDSDSDGSTVSSMMLPLGASSRLRKSRRNKKGKGKSSSPKLAPKKILASATTSLEGSSNLPVQQKTVSEEIFIDKDGNIDLFHDAAMNIISTAYIKVME